MSVPDIPGIRAAYNETLELRKIVSELAGTKSLGFPGSQPVSFTRTESIPELMNEDYFLCEKTDGVRVLMLMIVRNSRPETYFITRKNEYFLVPNVHFPVPTGKFDQFHNGTLVDCELVIDIEPNGARILRLLAFDALVEARMSLMDRPLTKRLGYLEQHIINPYREMCARVPGFAQKQPFIAEMKPFELGYAIDKVLNQTIPNLKHKSDGLIFTSVNAPYTPGTCTKIIKWKPASENSVDFKVVVNTNSSSNTNVDGSPIPDLDLYVWHGNTDYKYYAKLGVTSDDWNQIFSRIPDLDGKIIEAAYDPAHCPPAVWRFMRLRDDKGHGNFAAVLDRILVSIRDGIEAKELIDLSPKIRSAYKARLR